MVWVEIAVGALVTLLAAFAGSWSAFKLEDRERARKTVRDRVAAINRAQFELIAQFNKLKNIQAQMIDRHRTDPLRSINMRPSLPFSETARPDDTRELSFLLETEDRNFPFMFMLEQRRFDVALQAVDERSRLHIIEVQPKLAVSDIKEGGECTRAFLATVLGDQLLLRIERATDSAMEAVDLTIASSQALIASFYAAMKLRFPGETIIRLDPSQPPDLSRHPTSGAVEGARDEDPADCLTREEYFAERELLLEARQRGYQRAEQMVMGGATGALVLSITFLENLVPAVGVVSSYLLVSAWVVLISSLCLSLLGQYVSAMSFTVELQQLDASVNRESARSNRWKQWNKAVGILAAALLALGIVMLARFAYINAPFNK